MKMIVSVTGGTDDPTHVNFVTTARCMGMGDYVKAVAESDLSF
jgi:hypothetical protein